MQIETDSKVIYDFQNKPKYVFLRKKTVYNADDEYREDNILFDINASYKVVKIFNTSSIIDRETGIETTTMCDEDKIKVLRNATLIPIRKSQYDYANEYRAISDTLSIFAINRQGIVIEAKQDLEEDKFNREMKTLETKYNKDKSK